MFTNFPYPLLDRASIIERMNEMGRCNQPFLFIIDYHAQSGFVIPKEQLDDRYVQFSCYDSASLQAFKRLPDWERMPVEPAAYAARFNYVMQQIQLGNSFLTNLTQPTGIQTNLSLEELFHGCYAPYKLWLKDAFLVLSPEAFVTMQNGIIKTFPMKGTIDASLPNAHEKIMNDEKERAEHATIVDLMRNDLSLVAEHVNVSMYRYVETIKTLQKDLLQVSSEIRGELPDDYLSHLGDIMFKLLPAGSISGAPKPKTLEIIEQAEGYDRGFYTGVYGYFHENMLNSAVMIRFIEQTAHGLVFKSGGGITFQSEMATEYNELIQKVYVPVS